MLILSFIMAIICGTLSLWLSNRRIMTAATVAALAGLMFAVAFVFYVLS